MDLYRESKHSGRFSDSLARSEDKCHDGAVLNIWHIVWQREQNQREEVSLDLPKLPVHTNCCGETCDS